MDILEKWDNDNSINVISTDEVVVCKPQTSCKRGERVKMWRDALSSWYYSIIIDTDEPSESDCSDHDVPLQRLIEKHDPIQYSYVDQCTASTIITAAGPNATICSMKIPYNN